MPTDDDVAILTHGVSRALALLELTSLRSILGACVLVGPPWLLVMAQPDLGTSLVLLAILGGMLFMSGASMRWLAAMGQAVGGLGKVLWHPKMHVRLYRSLLAFAAVPEQVLIGIA